VFTNLFPWLMGPMKGVDHVDVPVPDNLRNVFKFLPATVSLPQAGAYTRPLFGST
jgi:hypothetical protein